MLKTKVWKPKVQGRASNPKLEARAQDFSQVVSRALVDIEPNEKRRTFLHTRITEAQPSNGWANIAEAKALVETLDKLVERVTDKAVRDHCLRILSEICCENVILPESYVISNVSLRKKWKCGGVADIWTGKLEEEDVCIKVFRQHESRQQERIKGLCYYYAIRWKYVSHENVLPFLGISEALPPFGLVSPRMQNMNILEYIKENQGAERLSLLAGAACGIEYLHSIDIVHGGISPGNILVTEEGTACIGDFEIAMIITNPLVTGQCSAITCRRSIVRYMGPEQINPKDFGMPSSEALRETDVYSFAMAAYEVLTETEPYAEIAGGGPLALTIIGGNRPPRPNNEAAVRWLSDPVWRMMGACWIPQPQSRLPIQEVIKVLQNPIARMGSPTPKGAFSLADKPNGDRASQNPSRARFSLVSLLRLPTFRVGMGLLKKRKRDHLSKTDPHNASESSFRPDLMYSGKETLPGQTLEKGPPGVNAHPTRDTSQCGLPAGTKEMLEVSNNPDLSPTEFPIYNTDSGLQLLILGPGCSIETPAVPTSPDDVDLGGLAPSSDPPPPKSADESQDYLAQESTDSLDTVYPPETASIGSPLHGYQGENAIDHPLSSTLQSPLHLEFNTSVCKRVITHDSSQTEYVPLLREMFTSQDEVKMIWYLCGDDAQTFINVMDEALDRTDLPQWLRRKCLNTLCKMCGRHALLPKSLKIPLCYDRFGAPLYRGGYADVWKGEHQGRQVAVKVLRVYVMSDFEKTTSRFCKEVVTWKALRHPNVLPLLGVTMDNSLSLFAMASEWMENGNINEFLKSHQDANRFELLKDVAKGLIYMHSQGVIHGDLKGANILINQDGHACLADFGLATIASDPTNPTTFSSSFKGGTTRWMSPELLDPDLFGIQDSRPTKESDAYALGMVIFEVLSGHPPFKQFKDVIVMRMVLEGKRPERPNGPEGVLFTDDLWQQLTQCRKSHRKSRLSIEDILKVLEQVSTAWKSPSLRVREGTGAGGIDPGVTTAHDSSAPEPRDLQSPSTNPPEEDPPNGVQSFENGGLTNPEPVQGLVDALGLGGGSFNPSTRSTTLVADRGLPTLVMHPPNADGAKKGFGEWWGQRVHSVSRAMGLRKRV